MVQTDLAEDRERVLRELQVNMVVEAGAGTGKTSLLIRRICLAALVQGIAMDKIVALTFTEKAAAEIKNRLVNALHQLVQDIQRENDKKEKPDKDSLLAFIHQNFPIKNDVLLTRAQSSLSRLDRASVGTIHGFCADILRTFPLEAGLSPQAEIDSGAKAARLFNMRWNLFLDSELGVNAPRAEQWKQVLPEISLDELKTFAKTLCSGKIEKYDYFSHADMLAGVCMQSAARAHAWSTAFLEPGKPARLVEKSLMWAENTFTRMAAFLRGEEVPAPQEKEEPARLSATLPKGWDESAYADARELVQFAVKMNPERQAVFRQAYALVKDVAAQIRADFEREGVLSFDDLIVKTRQLVQSNINVRNALKEKLDVFFIDEFQDTDPVQGELLLFLAEEKSSCASRWQEVKLQPGKLIVVGDPKQSIYRFRGADITAYELFTQLILSQGGVKCFLRQNYRSVPDIVAMANCICRQAMVQETAFQPAYEAIYPTKPARPRAVRWLFVNSSSVLKGSADDFRDNQGEAIAQWIEENVGKLTLSSGNKLTYKDIVILSRAGTTAGPYTQALRRHGIAFTAEKEKDYFKRQEVSDFLNFLRVLLDPSDTTALVGVLRSPLGGLTDEEIYQLSTHGELHIYAHTAHEAASRVYRLLADFSCQVGRTSVQNLLADVLGKTFLPEVCAAAYEGEKTLEILTQLIGCVTQQLGDRPASLGQFLEAVQEVLEAKPEQLNIAGDSGRDAVCVMTMHKSKGLDFPVVILADLSKQGSTGNDTSTLHLFSWQYNMHGLRAGKICDVNLAFLEEEQKKHERCEEIRVLYVGLTRAKEQMVLVADNRKGALKAAQVFAQAGFFPDGTTEMLGNDEVKVPVTYIPYDDPANFRYHHAVASAAAETPEQWQQWRQAFDARHTRYEAALSEQNLSPSARVESHEQLTDSQRAAAEVGTVCHRAMQILLTEPKTDVSDAVRASALSGGLAERERDAAEIIVPFVQSSLFSQLCACKLLAAEMPFSYVAENGLIENGVMDAVLENSDGTIWVVDYKTDKIPAGGTQQLVEKYRPQLEVYQQAAQKIFTGKTVRCSAVFLRVCESVSL